MIVIPARSALLQASGKHVVGWIERTGGMAVEVDAAATRSLCPGCDTASARVHGWVMRTLADCPTFGASVTLRVRVWRFKCVNAACPRSTCCESIEPLAAARQRRTGRSKRAHGQLSYALGGRTAARLAVGLGMQVHATTLLVQLRSQGCPVPAGPVSVIGLDNWALARSRRYGTIVVDLHRRRPIALLAGRDGSAAARWLAEHPGVQVVARDRHGPYAHAVERVLPHALQVADRWHLLGNMADALERLLLRSGAAMREAARLASRAGDASTGADDAGECLDCPNEPRVSAAQRRSVQRRQARLARYEDVVRRRRAGESIIAIARHTGLDRMTVREFARADIFSERSPYPPKASIVDAHRPYLRRRAAQGMRNATGVWRELRERGFDGGASVVKQAFAALRPSAGGPGTRSSSPPSARRACAWLLGWNRQRRASETTAARQWRLSFVATLCRLDRSVAQARRLAQHFVGVLTRGRTARALDDWLTKVKACGVTDIKRFAQGLLADYSAVRAAVTSRWSSGQVEGQINRLKMIKGQMYGRAKLDLLRIRFLHPN